MDEENPKEAMAKELMAALKSNDAAAFASAFESFVYECTDMDDDTEEAPASSPPMHGLGMLGKK
jgi:hypothetical protein